MSFSCSFPKTINSVKASEVSYKFSIRANFLLASQPILTEKFRPFHA
jgi:hypothetical protein